MIRFEGAVGAAHEVAGKIGDVDTDAFRDDRSLPRGEREIETRRHLYFNAYTRRGFSVGEAGDGRKIVIVPGHDEILAITEKFAVSLLRDGPSGIGSDFDSP